MNRHADSRTLREWRETTLPTPDGPSFSYWSDRDTTEDLHLTTRGEAVADKLRESIDARRHPDADENPNPRPQGWPGPMSEAAYHGLAGTIVGEVSPYTEASPEALLTDLLASFGVMVGKGPYLKLGGGRQQPRLYVCVVGASAKGRKGAARSIIEAITEKADMVPVQADGYQVGTQPWAERHYLEGLTSGEGLIAAVEKTGRDGRVLIVEEEFARLLTVAAREGSTVSHLIRKAFDRNRLKVTNKNTPLETSNAYVGIVANVTKAELMSALEGRSAVEALNGFGNRFLYIASRRPHLLPMTALPERLKTKATRQLRDALKKARRIKELTFNVPALRLWREFYREDQKGSGSGLYDAMTARFDVHALRLAMTYALLDGRSKVNSKHIEAASEVIRYADQSARYIIGDATGNPIADKILRELRKMDLRPGKEREKTLLTKSDIYRSLGNHASKPDIDGALAVLLDRELITKTKEKTGGRPREVFESV